MTLKEFARKVFAGQWPILLVGAIIVAAFGLVILRTQPEPPSAVIAERRMIVIMVITMMAETPNGMGCWKAIRKSCTGRC